MSHTQDYPVTDMGGDAGTLLDDPKENIRKLCLVICLCMYGSGAS